MLIRSVLTRPVATGFLPIYRADSVCPGELSFIAYLFNTQYVIEAAVTCTDDLAEFALLLEFGLVVQTPYEYCIMRLFCKVTDCRTRAMVGDTTGNTALIRVVC